MKKIAASLLSLFFCLFAPCPGQGKRTTSRSVSSPTATYQRLESRTRNGWTWSASWPAAKRLRAFLGLQTAAIATLFIRLFWQQRDPTPGTEANEYRARSKHASATSTSFSGAARRGRAG